MPRSNLTVDRRRLMTLGAGLAVASCAEPASDVGRTAPPGAPIPIDLSPTRLMRITVCARPFRAAGPRLEAGMIGDKRVIHNYGHGGAGWSLTWGCAEDVARLASQEPPRSVAVIGAGAIGLASATRLIEEGFPVTIYAEEFPAESRSARATGTWSPDSRIALGDVAAADFGDKWERWARRSYAAHQHFVGLDNEPVEFTPRYFLRDDQSSQPPKATRDFLHLQGRLSGLLPRVEPIEPEAYGFATPVARKTMQMTFNVAQYADDLMTAFFLRGGAMKRRRFHSAEEIAALPEDLVINCTGYGARALLGDDSVVPVRGQIAWLAPQPGVHYGVYYRNGTVLARRDGIVIQDRGPNEDFGYGIEEEIPDRAEFEAVLATLASGYRKTPDPAI
ncbi:MAG: FAD-dependent oxidoreductase [Pseudomonadota bacterium]